MTAPLSPTAQAVLDAFMDAPVDMGGYEMTRRRQLAKAVIALADQVVPDGPIPSANSDYHLQHWSKSLDQYGQRQASRAELLAIATELDPNG